ncbi:LysM peptidoglycan-binding domain-containing protein [Defluviimonas sp. SAOS-178_SWC]|uniref:LysM peptidoglycan-binding domain-containing protein n=1 Tax=Defluviimonas sp. SAOS-178_SWC TaxID=3121287 RepID=UPI003222116F
MTDKKVAGASGDGAPSGGPGAGLGWIFGALAGLGVAVLVWYFGFRAEAPEAEPVATTEPAATESAPAATEPAAAPKSADTAEPQTAMAPVPPRFDTVRVDADGSVLVAGRAATGAAISILVDGAEAASTVADAGGAFAALFTLMPSEAPRVMTLVAMGADGVKIASEADVIVAPFAAPVAVASAAPGDGSAPATPAEPAPAPEAEVAATKAEPAAGPEILIVDAGGVRKQTDPAPVAEIVIDTIGYGASGEVEIAGRGRAGAFARLYLDNVEADTLPIGAEGSWRAALSGVAAGIYTLRVDQIDGAGKVSSRFETPFQREEPETVTAALQSAAPTPAPSAEPAAAPEPAATAAAPAEPQAPAALPQAGAPEVAAGAAVTEVATAEAPAPSTLAAVPEAPASPSTKAVIVTVQPGFSLWRIARENYGEGILYVKVYEANKDQIRNPDLIYPGQIFTVPSE